MANYQLSKTGQEIDAALDKIEATPTITSIGDGLSLTSGVLSASGGGGGGTQLYAHIISTVNGVYTLVNCVSTPYTSYNDDFEKALVSSLSLDFQSAYLLGSAFKVIATLISDGAIPRPTITLSLYYIKNGQIETLGAGSTHFGFQSDDVTPL